MADKRGKTSPVDFTVLEGVGSKTAKALKAAGFTSMNQLATARVADLVDRLDDVGSPVPASRVVSQRWLFQAWELTRPPVSDRPAPTMPAAEPAAGSTTEPTALASSKEADDWTEHATFIVSFDRQGVAVGQQWRTRVWDTNLMVEEVFIGTDPAVWANAVWSKAIID